MRLSEIIPKKASVSTNKVDDFFFSALVSENGGHQLTNLSYGTPKDLLNWYPRWLEMQFNTIPPSIQNCVQSLPEIFKEIATHTDPTTTIDEMASLILRRDIIKCEIDHDKRLIARSVAFAVLGWQTMLYLPDLGACPLQQLAIADVMDGYSGQVFMKFKQDESAVKRSLSDFVLGFGLMLPKENICVSEDLDDCQAFEKADVINPKEFNAYLLQQFAKVDIEWVDVLAPHLEFDKATNKLYLFKHPSFCMANLSLPGDQGARSMIYNCASHKDSVHCGSEMEISQLLREILLSYRLLFGQSKMSREIFKDMLLDDEKCSTGDTILAQLCSSKVHQFPELFKDRDFYRLKRDFPILRSRLAILSQQMSNVKPRGWKELWRDKRDSAQWLTFWAVIIIGGSGVLLAIIQVLLQAVQLARS